MRNPVDQINYFKKAIESPEAPATAVSVTFVRASQGTPSIDTFRAALADVQEDPKNFEYQHRLGSLIGRWAIPQLHDHIHGSAPQGTASQIFNAFIPALHCVDHQASRLDSNSLVRVCKQVADMEGLSKTLGAKAQIVAAMTEALKNPCYFDAVRAAPALGALARENKIASTPTYKVLSGLLRHAQEKGKDHLAGFSMEARVNELRLSFRA